MKKGAFNFECAFFICEIRSYAFEVLNKTKKDQLWFNFAPFLAFVLRW
jgi:hypothetical protein